MPCGNGFQLYLVGITHNIYVMLHVIYNMYSKGTPPYELIIKMVLTVHSLYIIVNYSIDILGSQKVFLVQMHWTVIVWYKVTDSSPYPICPKLFGWCGFYPRWSGLCPGWFGALSHMVLDGLTLNSKFQYYENLFYLILYLLVCLKNQLLVC